MTLTTTQAEKILKSSQAFPQLGFALLVTRLRSKYAQDPSPQTLEYCTKELTSFTKTFQDLMEADFELIEKL
ncbi:MAG: hypothetical protein FWC78_03010 [Defluviitaleaceae bacterium]|nr:hypothetical protein [Defluviitaleaceae bacterium]